MKIDEFVMEKAHEVMETLNYTKFENSTVDPKYQADNTICFKRGKRAVKGSDFENFNIRISYCRELVNRCSRHRGTGELHC